MTYDVSKSHSLLPITGTISSDRSYLHNYVFIYNEVKFILAHEGAHIFKNHLVATVFWYLIEQLAKGARNENYYSVEWDLLQILFLRMLCYCEIRSTKLMKSQFDISQVT
jgi:peptidase M48-like protein